MNFYNLLSSIYTFLILGCFIAALISINTHYSIDDKNISINYMTENFSENFSEKEILNQIIAFVENRDSLYKDINTSLLEDLILSNKYIRKAEVYLDAGDSINIFIYLIEPFVRLLRDYKIYYYDYDLMLLPGITDYDKNLLIITGDVTKQNFHNLVEIVDKIYESKLLNSLIGGIHYTNENLSVLSSKICDLKISIRNSLTLNNQNLKQIELFSVFLDNKLGCDYCKELN